MLNDIQAFTRSFGVVDGTDFTTFTVANYINYINESLGLYINATTDKVDDRIKRDAKFGIGLPPELVAEYARRVWKFNATVSTGDQPGDAIVGVKDSGRWFNGYRLYDGLIHYVYRKNNKYYTWGHDPYDYLRAADPGFQMCCTVKLSAV